MASTTRRIDLAIRTPEAYLLLGKLQTRSLVRALVLATFDQHKHCEEAGLTASHADARRKTGRALQELLLFLAGAGVYMPGDAARAMALDFQIEAQQPSQEQKE